MSFIKFKTAVFILCILGVIIIFPTNAISNHKQNGPQTCTKTAKFLNYACEFETRDDYLTGITVCLNISDKDKQRECINGKRLAQRESREECRNVLEARKELCNEVGEEPYDPPFGEEYADSFVDPLEIGNGITPNPFFPLVQGNKWVYEGVTTNDDGEEVTETIEIVVTNKTKLIDGITCVVVNDVVAINGVTVENTDDWYAQDTSGNVWYCGEIVLNFENFEGDNPELPEITDINGSWKAGRDGSKAGIQLPFSPVVGEFIRQEVTWGEAEDVIEVLGIDATETSPAASCNSNCLVTRDFTPLDAEANENKYYAPGTGLIVEIDLNTGDRVVLKEFTNTP